MSDRMSTLCIRNGSLPCKKGGGVFDSPTGIEQIIPLVGDMDLDTEIMLAARN